MASSAFVTVLVQDLLLGKLTTSALSRYYCHYHSSDNDIRQYLWRDGQAVGVAGFRKYQEVANVTLAHCHSVLSSQYSLCPVGQLLIKSSALHYAKPPLE